jgi:predicted transposase YdaD
LRQLIVTSVQTDERRRETDAMTRTIAEALRDEGRKEGRKQGRREGELRARQQMLLRLLRLRFKKLPKAVERTVLTTEDLARLETWLDRFATANTLEEIGIQS